MADMTEERWAEIAAIIAADAKKDSFFVQIKNPGSLCCEIFSYAVELRAERLETTEYAFYSGAEQCKSGEREGWWDTLALSDIRDFGDELVEAGVFEKHPDGYGRRQFYRPIKK